MKKYIIEKLIGKFERDEISRLLRILKEDISDFKVMDQDQADHIVKRLLSDEPIQYITGIAPFYGYFFNVNDSVLIPRPETEELVYEVEKYIKSTLDGKADILDIGSGSGCIPITINLLLPKTKVISVDVSSRAIRTAKGNNSKLSADVKFLEIDFLDEKTWDRFTEGFDVIVSNPPYIPNNEKVLMHNNVLAFEPHLALFVKDDDPLLFYRKIYNYSLVHLNENGRVFLECNEFNAQDVKEMFTQNYAAEIIKDMEGKDRMVIAY